MKPAWNCFLSACILVLSLLSSAKAAVPFATPVVFNNTNGASSFAGLVLGTDGNYYGTASAGGDHGLGTIFRMTPAGTLSNLISFNGTNGANPCASLILGNDGNFYGTTFHGGSNDNGTVFQINSNGSLRTLFWFDGTHGAWPQAGLVQGKDNFFYGTTTIGGSNGAGTIFQLSTNSALANSVSLGTNGFSPYAGLIQGADGSFYGTTFQGGLYGYGTVFALRGGLFTNLYSFTGTNDGTNPDAGLLQDANGDLWGATYYGGAYGFGAVFKLTTNGVCSNLFSFANTNGANPQAGLIQGADGNFYGTTQTGGAYTNQNGFGYGTAFRLTTNGVLTTLISFDSTNGAFPEASLIQGANGEFYGTTASGAIDGVGTIYRFTTAPSIPPVFQTIAASNTDILLTWTATPGRTYQMQRSTSSGAFSWQNIDNAVYATNTLMTTPENLASIPQGFYRIYVLP